MNILNRIAKGYSLALIGSQVVTFVAMAQTKLPDNRTQEEDLFPAALGFLLLAGLYVYTSICLQKLAQKMGHEDSVYMAWIPIINIFLIIKLAGNSFGTFILLLIPLVNIFVYYAIWDSICTQLYKSRAIALGMLLPGISLICLGYLAFSRMEAPFNISAMTKGKAGS